MKWFYYTVQRGTLLTNFLLFHFNINLLARLLQYVPLWFYPLQRGKLLVFHYLKFLYRQQGFCDAQMKNKS